MAFYAGQKLRAGDLGQLSTSAQYTGSVAQTINSGADTPVAFDTADFTTSYITRNTSGVGHSFTVNVPGIWAVTVTLRWSTTGASATGEKAAHIENSLGLWHCSSSLVASTTVPVTHEMSFTKYIDEDDIVLVEVYQNSGGTEDLDASALFGTPRINLALILAS